MADPKTLIATAVKIIRGEQYDAPSEQDKYFLGDIIINMSNVLRRNGPPTIKVRNMSIEIGELTQDDCQNGHNTFTSHDQNGRRDAFSLNLIAWHVYRTDVDVDGGFAFIDDASEYGRSFDFAVCQAFPAFINAIHDVHTDGFTADTVREQAKTYWLTTFGFWA